MAINKKLIGCRVHLSPAGQIAIPRMRDKAGSIVGESHTRTCWIVQFDDHKTTARVHKSFVEIVAVPAQKPTREEAPPPEREVAPTVLVAATTVANIRDLRRRGWSLSGISRRLGLPVEVVAEKIGIPPLEKRA